MALSQGGIQMKNKHPKKWTNSIWFIRLISLLFAIFLYAFVGTENNRFATRTNNTSINVSETVSNVPVQLGEIDDDVFVSELPESVSVKITGPQNIVTQVLAQDLYVVTENLRGQEMGRAQVRLEMPNELEESGVEYQITPSRVIVDLDRLASKEVELDYELSEDLIPDGYEVESVSLDPATVTLTGKQSTIDKVDRAYVKITNDEPITDTFTGEFPIEIRDSSNNLLDLNADISHTSVTIEVNQIGNSQANVNLEIIGENTDEYTYQYEVIGPNAVSLDGDNATIEGINQVTAVLDMSQITESGTYQARIQPISGVNSVTPSSIDVRVTAQPLNTNQTETTQESSVLPSNQREETPTEVEPEVVEENLGSESESIVSE